MCQNWKRFLIVNCESIPEFLSLYFFLSLFSFFFSKNLPKNQIFLFIEKMVIKKKLRKTMIFDYIKIIIIREHKKANCLHYFHFLINLVCVF